MDMQVVKQPILHDGHVFHAPAERDRYVYLKGLKADGVIVQLAVRPRYVLVKAFKTASGICHPQVTFTPHFSYFDMNGRLIVETVKQGRPSRDFHLQRKLWQQQHLGAFFSVVRPDVGGLWTEEVY